MQAQSAGWGSAPSELARSRPPRSSAGRWRVRIASVCVLAAYSSPPPPGATQQEGYEAASERLVYDGHLHVPDFAAADQAHHVDARRHRAALEERHLVAAGGEPGE